MPDSPGLRPTPDRVRETLFNWLTGVTPGARVLDLYAGTGALGLEALSRGARQACFVERESRVAQGLGTNLETLGASDRGRVAAQATEVFLAGPATPFDLVFLDPPFRQELAEAACVALEENGWLAPEAWIYVEVEQELALSVPARWQLHREVKAGDTLGRLYRRQARHASPSPAGDAC
ncbi:16S rRNA (guanine(966)-N(2))-methyltransferase RsmD [Halomonas salifodinae]